MGRRRTTIVSVLLAAAMAIAGAALRALSQFDGLPVYVVNSTFGGGPGLGDGANPAQPGTPGGGSGGAIHLDGNTFSLSVAGTRIEDNHANEGGGAVFFVSNDRTGTFDVVASELRRNPSDVFETAGFPGIFYLGSGPITVVDSVIE